MNDTQPEDLPETEWDHCHAVQDGDVLVDQYDQMFEIELLDDGSVIATDEYGDSEPWTQTELARALRDDVLHRHRDGKSWILAG